MPEALCHHVVYWSIPQIDDKRRVVGERHYAVNLNELDLAEAEAIEGMLRSYRPTDADPSDRLSLRTDPGILRYRERFRPFIDVKRRAHDLCRFSVVWLPYAYAEYADEQREPRHHAHPSVRSLAVTG
ncbi:MAG: hypothetical protein ACPGYV_08720 [Phycisphaeraceae bacterium]